MRSTVTKRLKALEQRAGNVRKEHITCTPMPESLMDGAEELAPGVFTSRYHYPNQYMSLSVLYTDEALLRAWLDEPERKNNRSLIYHVLTQAECDSIRAEVEKRI